MTCNNSQAYTKKTSPVSKMDSLMSDKASPFTKKVITETKKDDIRQKQCLDFVVKTFENDDFFMLQDDSTLIMNLTN